MSPEKWYCCCLVLLQCLAVYTEDACSIRGSCKECISTPNCYWCSHPVKGEANDVHCIDKSKAVEGWCSDDSKEEYHTEYHEEEKETSSQIQPQKSRLKLRLGEEYNIKIRFVKARDYPVDLYYLLDLSQSMRAHKEKLSSLGDDLTKAMKNLTSNFRLGFGSFVDKITMPYVSTVPDKLKHPCQGCAPPYSFKNHMPLDINTTLFKHRVYAAPMSGNIDSPEGGFDALMQAMVCTDHIKWRENARRLLVFSTDAPFHLAGDGRLAGITEPNDGLCHMKDDEYTDSLLFDYPSIAQLDNTAVENNINIIFAVTSTWKDDYLTLSRRITGSSFGVLSDGFQNIVEQVHAQSEKLTQSVMMSGRVDKRVEIHYYSKCLDPEGELIETDKCENVKPNDNITFEARIKISECPPEYDTVWNTTLQFKPVGINETLDVELAVYCGCRCEKKEEHNSSLCSSRGTLKCGTCQCNKGLTGRMCECDESSLKSNTLDDSNCRMDNKSKVCSGHGTCICGVCECYKGNDKEQVYSGKFCQCDNFSCERHDGKLCSGHGDCKCGNCHCSPGWKGNDCRIRDNRNECIDPTSNKECSDHGKCDDGECLCDQGYAGTYCQDCLTCPGGHCMELRDCVECLVYKTGECVDPCENLNITINDVVDELTEEDADEDKHFCPLPDGSSCTIIFIYQEKDGLMNVTAQREKECRGVGNVLAVVFGVVGSTILIGLLFIIFWKLLTTIHDNREFAKFEKERAKAKFDRGENPLYRGAITKFDNPTFSGN
ncbi:integrin beta-PS isoform X2 [Anabrus simplex]|uniref:integrin beta-PS isoform X2 n=1 Tax=Anabrus simplex TaxID=316456 RepID=UPI0035A28032